MTGRIISEPVAPHACSGKPRASDLNSGTVWECDDCGQQWVVEVGAQYNETWSAWHKRGQPSRKLY